MNPRRVTRYCDYYESTRPSLRIAHWPLDFATKPSSRGRISYMTGEVRRETVHGVSQVYRLLTSSKMPIGSARVTHAFGES